MPNNKLAPNLAKRGIQTVRYQRNDDRDVVLRMENPVVGGYTPEKVALRRAIALAVDVDARDPHRPRAARRFRRSRRSLPPRAGATTRRSRREMSDFDRAKAQALLDLYGYVDRDGDGWRDQPDGTPLVLEYATQPDELSTASSIEQWKKNMDAIGIRIVFRDRAVAGEPEGRRAPAS